jgi:hypothetical protein
MLTNRNAGNNAAVVENAGAEAPAVDARTASTLSLKSL